MKWRVTIILVCICFLGCEKYTFWPDDHVDLEPIIPRGDEKYLNTGSDYIFNQDSLHTFELTIPRKALMELDINPAAEEYVEASLTFNGETIAPIGVRYKGSVGAFTGCVSGWSLSDPKGRKTCTKLSMKVKIDWDDPDVRFYGLKRLQFHAQKLDPSQLHERLAYWLFREMGVPAPRAVHVRLVINGVYSGLYTLVEQIDECFASYNFENGTGNIYKEVWPVNNEGRAYEGRVYYEHLETDSNTDPNSFMIGRFAMDIAASELDKMDEVVAKWMDVDKMISYAVVDRTIRHDDGPFHWYCNEYGCRNHNYYWYEEPDLEKLFLIPWDLDMAFKNIESNNNPNIAIADEWGESRSDCEPFFFGLGDQRSAACDKLTHGWTLYKEEYEQTLEYFIDGPLSEDVLDPLLAKWVNQIRESTIEAAEMHSDALSMNKWEKYLERMHERLDFARNN